MIGRDRDVEVGGRDVEPVRLRRFELDVGKDGHRALLLDDTLRAGECASQLLDADLQFHEKRSSLLFLFVVDVGDVKMWKSELESRSGKGNRSG
jgi:Mg-chelatase subunit ChlD